MESISWTAGSGQKIRFEISTGYKLDSQGRRKTSGRMEVIVNATVDGAAQFGGYLKPMDHPVVKGCFGNIGLVAANYDRIEAAINTAKQQIADHNAALDAHEANLYAIDDQSAKFATAMSHGEVR